MLVVCIADSSVIKSIVVGVQVTLNPPLVDTALNRSILEISYKPSHLCIVRYLGTLAQLKAESYHRRGGGSDLSAILTPVPGF